MRRAVWSPSSQGAAAPFRRRPLVWLGLAAIAGTLAATACGDSARNADGAYITTAIRHDRVGVALASLAREAPVSPELRRFGRRLERRHGARVERLKEMHRRIFEADVPANPTHGSLGLTDSQLGLPADPYGIDGERLTTRGWSALIELHHEGALRLAEALIDEGRDDELEALGRRAAAQTRRELQALYRATR